MNFRTRQPQGIPVGGQFAAQPHTEAGVALAQRPQSEIAKEAAEAAKLLDEQREFQRRQMVLTARRHQAIACAAAAHHVLQKHPDAAVLVFEVRDERPYRITEVFNANGNRATKKPAGDWADDAVREIRAESIYDLGYAAGIDTDGRELRVEIATALPAAAAVLAAPTPDLAERPLTAEDQKVLAEAADDAYSYVSGALHGDLGALSDEQEAALKKRRDDLGRLLGYDG